MNELNYDYKSILEAIGVIIKPDSRLTLMMDGQEFPIKLDGMDVYLPTDEALNDGSDTKVYFHPACESIISRETDIFKIVRRLIGLHLLVNFKKYPVVLFDIANRKHNKGLNNATNDILQPLKNVKQEVRREVADLFEAMEVEYNAGDNIDKRFIHFDITKGGKSKLTQAKIYYRARPIFPFFNEMLRKLARADSLSKDSRLDVCGVKVSYKALEVAVHLFKSIIPGVEDPESYETEQLTAEAARFMVMMNSYLLVANDINRVQGVFRSEFDKVGIYNLDTGFSTQLEALGEHYRQVPALSYNSQANTENAVSVQVNNHQVVSNLMNNTSNGYGNNQSVHNQHTGGGYSNGNNNGEQDSLLNGYRNKVIAGLVPGERWIDWTTDPATGNLLHHIDGPNGRYVKRFTKYGNYISSEGINNLAAYGSPYGAVGAFNPALAQYQLMLQQQQQQQMAHQTAAMAAAASVVGQQTGGVVPGVYGYAQGNPPNQQIVL